MINKVISCAILDTFPGNLEAIKIFPIETSCVEGKTRDRFEAVQLMRGMYRNDVDGPRK
jgi:hypothetical protein